MYMACLCHLVFFELSIVGFILEYFFFTDSTVTTVWYDPYDLRIVFMKRHLDSFAWRNALFHTLFWPLLLAFFPVIAMWPYMWYAW